MRVLHILGQRPDMTGSGMFLRNIWRCAAAAGDQLHLLCAGYADDDFSGFFGDELTTVRCGAESEYPDLIPGMSDVMPYPSRRYADLTVDQARCYVSAFRRRVDALIPSFAPDLIHVHHLWVQTGVAGEVDVPVVVTVHGTGLQQARQASRHLELFAGVLDEVALFMAVSEEVAADTRRSYGVPAERVTVVANGFDERVFFPPGEADEPVQRSSSTTQGAGGAERSGDAIASRPLIVAAGKYVEWKGFEHLIRALGRAELDDARLTILGTGPDERRTALLAEAEGAGLGERLALPGHVPAEQLAAIFRRADVFALPSLHEPFGLVLLEALACGCPVVASATAGPLLIVDRALIDAGLAALVEPPAGDAPADAERYEAALAAALRARLDRRAGLAERQRIAAAVAHLTWTETYSKMRASYARL
ncbi:MAG: glycosyltransferase family 4 protein [Acidobacteriota bacterium]|jgi:glycosyltransferase involved in cell wall biosynthesis